MSKVSVGDLMMHIGESFYDSEFYSDKVIKGFATEYKNSNQKYVDFFDTQLTACNEEYDENYKLDEMDSWDWGEFDNFLMCEVSDEVSDKYIELLDEQIDKAGITLVLH